MISDLASGKDKATVVVPCCLGQRDLGVIGPSKENGQQLPIFGIWHHTTTRSVVARMHWQCKSGIVRIISVSLCRVMRDTGAKPAST